jgi:hypothetical protein
MRLYVAALPQLLPQLLPQTLLRLLPPLCICNLHIQTCQPLAHTSVFPLFLFFYRILNK